MDTAPIHPAEPRDCAGSLKPAGNRTALGRCWRKIRWWRSRAANTAKDRHARSVTKFGRANRCSCNIATNRVLSGQDLALLEVNSLPA